MEIHIGDRVAEIELVSKEDNKVVLTIDGKWHLQYSDGRSQRKRTTDSPRKR